MEGAEERSSANSGESALRESKPPPGNAGKVEATQIEARLLAFVRREVFAPQINVTPETDLVGAGFDSMSLVKVLLFIEQTYGFWIPESEITNESLRDLRSLAGTVARLLSGVAGPQPKA